MLNESIDIAPPLSPGRKIKLQSIDKVPLPSSSCFLILLAVLVSPHFSTDVINVSHDGHLLVIHQSNICCKISSDSMPASLVSNSRNLLFSFEGISNMAPNILQCFLLLKPAVLSTSKALNTVSSVIKCYGIDSKTVDLPKVGPGLVSTSPHNNIRDTTSSTVSHMYCNMCVMKVLIAHL